MLRLALLALATLDADRDGLADSLERDLLGQFAPRFLVSRSECDGLPAAMQPDAEHPVPLRRDGTIYGRVAPARQPGLVEIQYFHLWANDCGRRGHPLDAERVTALVRLEDRRALHWYAAAHEGTLCDAANAAPARALDAERRGPRVWISAGKHASFLSEGLCGRGCGGDRCPGPRPLAAGPLVNLGEPAAPLAGARWMHSPRWTLAAKLGWDFPPALLAELDSAPGVITWTAPAQGVIRAGNATVDGIATGHRETGEALDTASAQTDQALARAAGSVDRSLRKSYRAVRDFLRTRRP
jgi:hypothetical protein